jgi:hypothetical protein
MRGSVVRRLLIVITVAVALILVSLVVFPATPSAAGGNVSITRPSLAIPHYQMRVATSCV